MLRRAAPTLKSPSAAYELVVKCGSGMSVFVCACVSVQYNDAKQHIRTDLARISGRAEEPMTAELNALDTAVTCMLVAKTLDRNALLLANHQTQLEGSGGGGEAAGGEKSKSKVKVEDLVRLCDNLLTNLGDLCDSVAGASGAAGVAEVCAVQDAALRGWRALYLAQVGAH
jgi:hypothetical protein